MSEFTGERVIPGQVDADLWNEHQSRYAFASQFAAGKRVLDMGCGTGYGSAELGRTAKSVIGLDTSEDAIVFANVHYSSATIEFHMHSCTHVPLPDSAFDTIVAFEVIEHLSDWRGLLTESKRLLAPGGTFLVSTPNRLYYAEQRKLAGPNPYHEHEFEFAEFETALREYFAEVSLMTQNRSEAFVFAPVRQSAAATATHLEDAPGARHELTESTGQVRSLTVAARDRLPSRDREGAVDAERAHFFLAVCGNAPVQISPYVYVPTSANLLRERELHIEKLSSELELKGTWLRQMTSERDQLQKEHDATIAHLEERNRWALGLETELGETRARVLALQEELAREQESARQTATAYESKVAELDEDIREKTDWALGVEARLGAELDAKAKELAEAVALLDRAETTVEERTRWAMDLDSKLHDAESKLAMIRLSRWVRLGRRAGVGPKLD